MTDLRTRSLERAAAGGDTQAGAALLRERMRSEQLERRKVEFAAYLGDEVSLLALEECPACREKEPLMVPGHDVDSRGYGGFCPACRKIRPWPKRMPMFPRWVAGLNNFGLDATAWVATVAAHEAYRRYHNRGECGPGCTRLCLLSRKAIRSAERYLTDPFRSDYHLDLCRSASAEFGSDEPRWAVFLGIGLYHYREDGPTTLERVVAYAADGVEGKHKGIHPSLPAFVDSRKVIMDAAKERLVPWIHGEVEFPAARVWLKPVHVVPKEDP